MKNLYDIKKAKNLDDLELRVYTSRLLGASDELVLHGGGNTSVKIDDTLYVKGSGWDLATIEKEGFSPVNLKALQDMAKLDTLSDSDMVRLQREAMSNKSAPNPSVEAILHAIIPFKYVDHTHADAVVTLSNSKDGQKVLKEIYQDFLIVPYVMPGFVLAKKVYEMTKDIEWSKLGGIILLNHGIFTFDDDAKASYDKMIDAVAKAQLEISKPPIDLAELKEVMSEKKGYEVSIKINNSFMAKEFSLLPSSHRYGILTPEHVLRTKRFPLLLEDDVKNAVESYIQEYKEYFNRYKKDHIMINPAPNWAVVRGYGVITFGKDDKECSIIEDIVLHTIQAVFDAKKYGGFESISEADTFAMEYWELEQAKLKKQG